MKTEKMIRGSGNGGGIIGTIENEGEIEIKGESEIEECKANEGNGGGMMMILNENGKIRLNRVIMKKNEVNQLNGMGGGIYLIINGDNPDWSFSSIIFEGNKGWKGRDLMFSCSNLRTGIKENKWEFASSYLGTSEQIMAIDSSVFSSPLPLLYFVVLYSSSTIHLVKGEEEGREGEEKWCGMSLYPCSSLSVGIFHMEGEYERTGYVMNQLNIDGCVELNNILLKTRSSPSSLLLSDSFPSPSLSSIFNCVGPSLFENLNFLLPSSISPCSPPLTSLLSSSVSLIFTNISIQPLSSSPSTSSLPFSLFSFLSGRVRIEGMKMKSIECSH
jgi:hypothetical protein